MRLTACLACAQRFTHPVAFHPACMLLRPTHPCHVHSCPAADEIIDIVDGPKMLAVEQVGAWAGRALSAPASHNAGTALLIPLAISGAALLADACSSAASFNPQKCLQFRSLPQLATLFAKFAGVLEEYEERRAERMQRMQSEVGFGGGSVRVVWSFCKAF